MAAVCRALRAGCTTLAYSHRLAPWGGLAAAAVGSSRSFSRGDRPNDDRQGLRRRGNQPMQGDMASGAKGLVFHTVDDYNQHIQMELNRAKQASGAHRTFTAYVGPTTRTSMFLSCGLGPWGSPASLCRVCSRSSRAPCRMFQRLMKLYDQMEADGVVPVKETYHLMILASVKAGHLQLAEHFFNEYRSTGCQPTVRAHCLLPALSHHLARGFCTGPASGERIRQGGAETETETETERERGAAPSGMSNLR